MADYEYVRRKSDGQYKSVDSGGWTTDRAKAFVFYEGCAVWTRPPLEDYEYVALSDDEVAEFKKRELVVGQLVVVVSGEAYGGEGTVIEITPWGVKVELDECSPLREGSSKKVYSFDHNGKECREAGTKVGIWKLILPDVNEEDREFMKKRKLHWSGEGL